MSQTPIYPPLSFQPVFKEKVWGGRSLESVLNKPIPSGVSIGESWEISGYTTDPTVVADGPFAGKTLRELFDSNPHALVGDACECSEFPLLYKFIDAQDRLSVQVHPDDAQAQTNGWGNFGKTECWHIVHAEPGAQTIAGFKPDVSLGRIQEAIREDSLQEILNFVDLHDGDMLLIQAGTVHANLTGTLLYEVQQTSDTTLRFYDWGRNAPDRPLHVEESLKIVDPTYHDRHKIQPVSVDSGADGVDCRIRVATRYFVLAEYSFSSQAEFVLPRVGSFVGIAGLEGAVAFETDEGSKNAAKGQSVLLPGSLKDTRVRGETGSRFMASWVPNLTKDVIEPARKAGIDNEQIEQLGGYAARNDLIPLM